MKVEYEEVEFILESSQLSKYTFSINFKKIIPIPQIEWINKKLKDMENKKEKLKNIRLKIQTLEKSIFKIKFKLLYYKLKLLILKSIKKYCQFWERI
jgi:hypothetical protein